MILTFSEAVGLRTGAENSNDEVFLPTGGGDLLVSLATVTNGSNVIYYVASIAATQPGNNYAIRVSNVADVFGNPTVPTTFAQSRSRSFSWRYDESGSDLSAIFAAPGFNDNAWLTGTSTFTQTGGKTVILPDFPTSSGQPASPILSPRSASGPLTTCFRTHFTLPTAPSNATVNIGYIADDGGIVYVNGNDVHRVHMAGGKR